MIGAIAGNSSHGRIRIGITIQGKQKHLQGNILAWYFYYGKLPEENFVIDHIDGDGMNNKISNLRKCTKKQNSYNRKLNKNNKTGFKGVYKRGNKFLATINHNQKPREIGRFSCPKEAAKAYDKEAIKCFGEYAKLNFKRENYV